MCAAGHMAAGGRYKLLADIPDCECRDGGPELMIRGEHPVVAMPVLPRWRHEVSEPIEELKWEELDDAVGARPGGLPPGGTGRTFSMDSSKWPCRDLISCFWADFANSSDPTILGLAGQCL